MQCPECNRLWEEYRSATVQHVLVDAALNALTPADSLEDFKALTLDTEGAEHIQLMARHALAEHLTMHRQEKAAGQS
jgi:hypothetical protein